MTKKEKFDLSKLVVLLPEEDGKLEQLEDKNLIKVFLEEFVKEKVEVVVEDYNVICLKLSKEHHIHLIPSEIHYKDGEFERFFD